MRRKAELSTSTNTPEQTRDRHGFRGLPPPATFDLYALPDSAPLTDLEVASVLRVSTNTTAGWRRGGRHPLKWFTLPGGFVRSTAGAVKALLAMGETRTFKPKPKDDSSPATTDEAAGEPRKHRDRKPKVARPPRRADRAADAAELEV